MKKDARKEQARARVKCPECGKVFWCREDWGYGIGNVDYCSWTCVRKAERREESAAKLLEEADRYMDDSVPAEEMTEEEKRAAAIRMLGAGYSNQDIMRRLKIGNIKAARYRSEAGLPPSKPGRIRGSEREEYARKKDTAWAMLQEGRKVIDICAELGVSRDFVCKVRREREAGN